MITQEIIERFFLKMIEDMRNQNIPIINNYWQKYGNFPSEKEIEEEDDEGTEEIEPEIFEFEL